MTINIGETYAFVLSSASTPFMVQLYNERFISQMNIFFVQHNKHVVTQLIHYVS